MTADEVLAEYGRLARNVAVHVWRKMNHDQAAVELDDLKQEACLALLAEAPRFDGRGDIDLYLVNRIRLRLIDYLRTVHGRIGSGRNGANVIPTDPYNLSVLQLGHLVHTGEHDDVHDHDAAVRFTRQWLSRANPVHARMIVLRLAGYTMAETARLTDRSESAVCLAEHAFHAAAREYGKQLAVAA